MRALAIAAILAATTATAGEFQTLPVTTVPVTITVPTYTPKVCYEPRLYYERSLQTYEVQACVPQFPAPQFPVPQTVTRIKNPVVHLLRVLAYRYDATHGPVQAPWPPVR